MLDYVFLMTGFLYVPIGTVIIHLHSQTGCTRMLRKEKRITNGKEKSPPPSFFVDGILILMGLYDAYNTS
jgi:hypothetical protein